MARRQEMSTKGYKKAQWLRFALHCRPLSFQRNCCALCPGVIWIVKAATRWQHVKLLKRCNNYHTSCHTVHRHTIHYTLVQLVHCGLARGQGERQQRPETAAKWDSNELIKFAAQNCLKLHTQGQNQSRRPSAWLPVRLSVCPGVPRVAPCPPVRLYELSRNCANFCDSCPKQIAAI